LPVRVALVLVALFGIALATQCVHAIHSGQSDGGAVMSATMDHAAHDHSPVSSHPEDDSHEDLAALCLTVMLAVLVCTAGRRPASGLGVARRAVAAVVSAVATARVPRVLESLCVLRV
jgi:hypothetical protein